MKVNLAQLKLQVQSMIKNKEYELYLAEVALDKKREELAFVKGAMDGLNTLEGLEIADEQRNKSEQQEPKAPQ